MKKLGFILIGIGALAFLGMLTCWALAIWQGDLRWQSTAFMLVLPCMLTGFGGAMAVSFSE